MGLYWVMGTSTRHVCAGEQADTSRQLIKRYFKSVHFLIRELCLDDLINTKF